METKGDTVYKKSAFHLSENDFFGAVYPFEDKQLSKSYVETITQFEDCVKGAGVQISLPNEELSLNVRGTVIWSRRINMEEETTVALGMRFQEMSPKARGMLLGFANSLEKFEEITKI